MLIFDDQIKKIALGTVQFGLNYGISNNLGKTSETKVGEILGYCTVNQIDTLDTAFGYGESEKVLGKFNLSDFKVISKFLDSVGSKGLDLEGQLEQSLNHLNLRAIYGYLAHRPLQVTNRDWDILLDLKNKGTIQKIGFSLNQTEEVDLVLKKGFIPDLVQAPFNYLDNRFIDKLSYLKDKWNTEIHTRSVFLQGLFFVNPNELPVFFDPVKKALCELESIESKAGALIKYVLDHPFIDKVVIGVNNLEQLAQNLAELSNAIDLKSFSKQIFPEECLMPSNWPKL